MMALIDDAGTIIAYTSIENNTGVYHFVIRDINGAAIADQTVGEKPLEPDPLGDTLAATIVTPGGALVVRSIAAGIARVATAAIASGARIVSLAVSRVLAGETTEGVVLTALRSIRAQAIVKALQARGVSIIVNVGVEAGSEEVAKWGVDQIARNHQVRMGIAKKFVPNLVSRMASKSARSLVKTRLTRLLPPIGRQLDVIKFARGASRVLKPGELLK